MQDSFCLAGLIYKFNHKREIAPIRVQLENRLQNRGLMNFVAYFCFTFIYDCLKFVFDYLFLRIPYRGNKHQKLAYEFEKTRKFHVTLLTLFARLLGMVEAMSGTIGYHIKVNIFRFIGYTGLAKYLFLLPAKPVV